MYLQHLGYHWENPGDKALIHRSRAEVAPSVSQHKLPSSTLSTTDGLRLQVLTGPSEPENGHIERFQGVNTEEVVASFTALNVTWE